MPRTVSQVSAVIPILICACGASGPPSGTHAPPAPPGEHGEPSTPPAPDITRRELAIEVDGLSGLTTDGVGLRWAVAESVRALVVVDGADVRTVPVEGVPDEIDLESIAWMLTTADAGSRFAIGTESTNTARTSDPILVVEVGSGDGRVTDRLELPYELLGIGAESNRGIEGLCHIGGVLVAAMENVVEEEGRRLAPLARWDGQWTVFRAALTTGEGKLSGLACRAGGDGIEVTAIERHYEVMRLVRYELPAVPGAALEPTLVLDLAGMLDGDPNLEGITVDGDAALLVVDNLYGERQGPNELIRVPNVF